MAQTSKFKGVIWMHSRANAEKVFENFIPVNQTPWKATDHISNKHHVHLGYYDTERNAAIAVDKALIKRGKDPVNILKTAKQDIKETILSKKYDLKFEQPKPAITAGINGDDFIQQLITIQIQFRRFYDPELCTPQERHIQTLCNG